MSALHRLYKDWRKYTTKSEHLIDVMLLIGMLAQIIQFTEDHDRLRLTIVPMYLLIILFMGLARISTGKHRELWDWLEDWRTIYGELQHQDTAYVKVCKDGDKLSMRVGKRIERHPISPPEVIDE